MDRFGVLAVCLCLLTGCVSAGAEATMLSDNTALVSATANDVSERDEVVYNALKEAANITSAHGYRYFVILSADNTSTTRSVSVPGQRLTFQMMPPRSFGATTLGPATYPGNSYTTPDRKVTRIKPGLDIIIQMYREGEIAPQREGVWNVDVVLGRFIAEQPPSPPSAAPPRASAPGRIILD